MSTELEYLQTSKEISNLHVRVIYERLSKYLIEAMDEKGNPKLPSKRALASIRHILPRGYEGSFEK